MKILFPDIFEYKERGSKVRRGGQAGAGRGGMLKKEARVVDNRKEPGVKGGYQ